MLKPLDIGWKKTFHKNCKAMAKQTPTVRHINFYTEPALGVDLVITIQFTMTQKQSRWNFFYNTCNDWLRNCTGKIQLIRFSHISVAAIKAFQYEILFWHFNCWHQIYGKDCLSWSNIYTFFIERNCSNVNIPLINPIGAQDFPTCMYPSRSRYPPPPLN